MEFWEWLCALSSPLPLNRLDSPTQITDLQLEPISALGKRPGGPLDHSTGPSSCHDHWNTKLFWKHDSVRKEKRLKEGM
ncbi:hypothetical protein GN956_G14895 [Arapaima gigas]